MKILPIHQSSLAYYSSSDQSFVSTQPQAEDHSSGGLGVFQTFRFLLLFLASLSVVPISAASSPELPYPAPFHRIPLDDNCDGALWRAHHPGHDIAVTVSEDTSLFTKIGMRLAFHNPGHGRGNGRSQESGKLKTVRVETNRLFFERENLSKEVSTSASGIKHTYHVHKRPDGPVGEPLVLRMRTAGNMAPVAIRDQAVEFRGDAPDLEMIYDGLHVVDAAGRELPARFRSGDDPGGFEIHVEDRDAVYPVAIDPLFRPLGEGGGWLGRDSARLVIDGEANIVRVHDGLVLVGVPGYDLEVFTERQIHERAIGGAAAIGAIDRTDGGLLNDLQGKYGVSNSGAITAFGRQLHSYLIMAGILPAPWVEDAGVVYAYTMLDGKWTLFEALNDWSEAAKAYSSPTPNRVYHGARFGESIAVAKGGIVIGAPGTRMELWVNAWGFGAFVARRHVVGATYLYDMPGSFGFMPPLAVRGIEFVQGGTWPHDVHDAFPQLGRMVAMGDRHAIVTSGGRFDVMGGGPLTVVGSGDTPQTQLHHFVKQGRQWVRLPDQRAITADHSLGFIDVAIVGTDAYVLKRVAGGMRLETFPCLNDTAPAAGITAALSQNFPGLESGTLVAGEDFLLLSTPQTGMVRVIRKTDVLEIEELPAPEGATEWGAHVAAAGEGILISGTSGGPQMMHYLSRGLDGQWRMVEQEAVAFPGGLRSLSASAHTVAALGRSTTDANKSELRLMPFERSISGTAYMPDGSPAAGREVLAIPQSEHGFPAIEATLFDGANFVPFTQKPWTINRNYGCALHFFVPDAFPLMDTFQLKLTLGKIPKELQGRHLLASVSLPLQEYTWGGKELFDYPAFGQGWIPLEEGSHVIDLWWGGGFEGFAWRHKLNVIGNWQIRIGVTGADLGHRPYVPIEDASLVIVEDQRRMTSSRGVKTDSQGRFHLGRLAPGSYRIQPYYDSYSKLHFPYRGGTTVYDLSRSPIHSGAHLQLEGNLGVFGRVTLQGQNAANEPGGPALSGVALTLTEYGGTTPLVETVTNETGDYVMSGLEAGARRLQIQGKWGPADGRAFGVAVSVTAGTEQSRRDIVLPPFVVPPPIEVRNSAGMPAAHVKIRIQGPFGYLREVFTDSSGIARMPAWNPGTTQVYPGIYQISGLDAAFDWSAAPVEITLSGGDEPDAPVVTPVLQAIGSEVTVEVTEAGEAMTGLGILAARVSSSSMAQLSGSAGKSADPSALLVHQSEIQLAPITINAQEFDRITGITLRHDGGIMEIMNGQLQGRDDIQYELTGPDGQRVELGPIQIQSNFGTNADGDSLSTSRRMDAVGPFQGLPGGEWRLTIRFPYPTLSEFGEQVRPTWTLDLQVQRHVIGERRTARTDAQGMAHFADLTGGNYFFVPTSGGSTPREVLLNEPGKWRYPRTTVAVAIGGNATLPLDVRRAHRLTGTVTGEMGPVPGARVVAVNAATGLPLAETRTDLLGMFQLEEVFSCDADLRFEKQGYDFTPSDPLSWRPLVRSVSNLRIQAKAVATLSGLVTAEDGSPRPGIPVQLVAVEGIIDAEGGAFQTDEVRDFPLEVDSDLVLGDLRLDIFSSQMQARMLLIHPSGRVVDLMDINSEARGLEHIRFDDRAELPRYGSLITYVNHVYRPTELLAAFQGLPIRGTWRLRVITPGAGGTVHSWKLNITPLSVSGPPLPRISYADEEGRVTFSGLTPWFYRLEPTTNLFRLHHETDEFDLTTQSSVGLAAIVEYPRVLVRTVDPEGNPVAGATVRLEQDSAVFGGTSDAAGEVEFNLPALADGRVSAWLEPTAYGDPRHANFSLAEESLQVVEIILRPRVPANVTIALPDHDRVYPYLLMIDQLEVDAEISGRFEFTWADGTRLGSLYHMTTQPVQQYWSVISVPTLDAGTHPIHWTFQPDDQWTFSEGAGTLELTVAPQLVTINTPQNLKTTYNGLPQDLRVLTTTSFGDDFEEAPLSNATWTRGGTNDNNWVLEAVNWKPGEAGPEEAHSGENVFSAKLSGPHNETESAWLRSPVIDLRGMGSAVLRFSEWRYIGWWHRARVTVRDPVTLEVLQVVADTAGDFGGWKNQEFQLSPASLGREVIIEFWLEGFTTADGTTWWWPQWFLDDFEVSAASPVRLSTTPADLPLTVLHNGSADLPVDAGTYQVDVSISDPNYSGSASFEWTIEPTPVTLIWSHDRAVFDGTSQVPVLTTDPPGIPVTIEGPAEAVNAGTYEFTVTVNDPNYSGSAALSLTIERAPQVIDFPEIPDQVYGDPPIILGVTSGTGMPLAFELIGGEGVFDMFGSSFMPLAAGDFEIEAREWMENPNYLPAEPVRRSFRVERREVELALEIPRDAVFNGGPFAVIPQAPEGTLEVDDLNVTYNGSAEPPSAAGTYAVMVSGENHRYRGSASGELVIARKPLTLEAPAELVFSGEPIVWPVSGIPDGVSFVRQFRPVVGDDILGSTVTDAGNYRLLVEVTDPNHQGSLDTLVEVLPVDAVISITPAVMVYNGNAQLPMATTDPAGLPLLWEIRREGKLVDSAVNAGVYQYQVIVDDLNFTASANGTFEIAKADAVLGFGDLETVYNSAARFPEFTVEPSGLTVRQSILRDGETVVAAIDAGTYQVHLDVEDPNYQGSANAVWTIAPQAIEIIWANTQAVYDGQVKAPTPTSVPDGVTLRVDGRDDAVDAGEYLFTARSADPNYSGETTITLTILAAAQSIDFPAIADRIYGDGVIALAATTSSGLPVSYRLIEGSGSFPDGASFLPDRSGVFIIEARQDAEEAGNYLPAEPQRRSFSVGLKEVVISLTIPVEAVYNGQPVAVMAVAEQGTLDPGELAITYNGTAGPPIDAGTYEILVSGLSDRFRGSASGVLVIAPAILNISAADELVYQGSPQAPEILGIAEGVSYTVEFFAAHDPELSLGSTVLDAGTYLMVVTITDPNYTGHLEQAVTVSPAGAEIHLSSDRLTYNGLSQKPAATTTPAGIPLTWTIQRDGSVVAEAVDAGIYQIIATIDDPNYSGSLEILWTIGKAAAVIEWRTPEVIDYRVPVALEAVASSGAAVSYEWVEGMGVLETGTLTLARPDLASSADPGPATIRAVASETLNFHAPDAVAREFSPHFANPSINIGQVLFYTGTAMLPEVTTQSAALDKVILLRTETGDSPIGPSAVGFYTALAIAEGPGYFGRQENGFRIAPASATITLANPAAAIPYDGSPKMPVFTTNPPGLMLELEISNSSGDLLEEPIEADSYLVTATITDPSYFGMTSILWVIDPIEAVFSFPEEIDGEITRYHQPGSLVTAPLVDSNPLDLPVRLSYWRPGMIAWTQETPQEPGRYTVIAEAASLSVIAEPAESIFVVRGVRFAISEAVDGVVTRQETGLPIHPPLVTALLEPENRAIAYGIQFRGTTKTGVSYGPSPNPPTDPGDYWMDVTSTEVDFPGSATFVLRVVSAADSLVWSPPQDLEQGQIVDLISLLAVPAGTAVSVEQVEGPLTRNGTVIWGEAADPALLDLPAEIQHGWVDLDLSSTRGIAALADGRVVTWGAPDTSNIRQLAPAGTDRVAAGEHEFAALNRFTGRLAVDGPTQRVEASPPEWLQGSFWDIKAGHSFFLARTRDETAYFGTLADGSPLPDMPSQVHSAETIAASGDLAAVWNGWELVFWGDETAAAALSDYPDDIEMLELSGLAVSGAGAMVAGYDWSYSSSMAVIWGDAPDKEFPPYSLSWVGGVALGNGYAMLINDLGTSSEWHIWGTREEVVGKVPEILSASGTTIKAIRASNDLAVVQYTTPDYRVAGTGDVTIRFRLSGGSLDGLLVERTLTIRGAEIGGFDAWAASQTLPPNRGRPVDLHPTIPLPNAVAYAMGLHPDTFDASQLPIIAIEPSENAVRLQFQRISQSRDVSLIVETSSDLKTWKQYEGPFNISPIDEITEQVMILLPNDGIRGFTRFKATMNESE